MRRKGLEKEEREKERTLPQKVFPSRISRVLQGKNLFEKRFFPPHPFFQKLSLELLLSFQIKAIPLSFLEKVCLG